MNVSWAYTHAKEHPGHTVRSELNLPEYCETCKAKSPAWNLLKSSTPKEPFTEDVTTAIREAMDTIRRMPPMAKEVRVTEPVYDALKVKMHEEVQVLDGLGLHPEPKWAFGIPIVIDPDTPPPGWKIVQNPEPPKVGDPCAHCGKPTSPSDFVRTATQITHAFCPPVGD